MKLKKHLKALVSSDPSIQVGYYPTNKQKRFEDKIIVRFPSSDKYSKTINELCALIWDLNLPYYHFPRQKSHFVVIIPHFYKNR